MPNFVFKDPLIISGSTGVSSTLVGETQAFDTTPIEISIGQSVGTSDNVVFNVVTGSTSAVIGTAAQNIVLSHQSISGSTILLDGPQVTVSQNFTSSLDMTVLGEISAKDIQAQHSSSVTIQNSGSTTFGNTLDDNHQRTGSLILSGSFGLNGYNITSVSNDSSLSNASPTAVLTEFAAKNSFAGTTTKSQYLRKSFAKKAVITNSTTASFNSSVTASAPSGLTATNEDDFMFFYNGMLMENDALSIRQEGLDLKLHIDSSGLGYSLSGDDEIVGFGKFNS